MSAHDVLACESLSVSFGTNIHAIRDVNLDFPAGKITSLIGPSGCGKTTLLRVLAGLQPPTSGNVRTGGDENGSVGRVAFVFQQPNLLPWRTALQNICLPLELVGASKQDAGQRAQQALSQVRLDDAGNRFPHQLSGGMKMRVSLARGLVTNPSVLLLDEPFAALDDILRHDLGDLLMQLWESQSFTAVMVTHNIAEAALLSHQIAVMSRGRLSRTIQNPLKHPRRAELRRTREFGEFYGVVSDALREAV